MKGSPMFGYLFKNGHTVEVQEWRGMGDGVEEYVGWCKTCDPQAEAVMKVDASSDPVFDFAMLIGQIERHFEQVAKKGLE